MNYVSIYSIIFLVVFFSCKTPKQSFEDYRGEIITLGSGGGFSGAYNYFSLLRSGDVYKYSTLSKERKYLGKISENVTEQLFKNYNTLKLGDINVNNPGNMNYSISYRKDKDEHKLLWSNMEDIDDNIKIFYRILIDMFKKLK